MQQQGEGQRQIILKALKSGRVFTLQDFRIGHGIANPNARISELVEQGVKIEKKWRDIKRGTFKTKEMTYRISRQKVSR